MAEDQTSLADWFGIVGPAVREQVKGLAYSKTLTVLTCAIEADDDIGPVDQADDEDYLKESWTPRSSMTKQGLDCHELRP